jgi:putative membrane protein insertion efficiency factor
MEKINEALRKISIAFIGFYQKAISPLFPAKCRYYPSCSQYAKEAITKHSLLKGCWLSLKRILKCNPFSKGGFDPVPEPQESIKKEK